MNEILINTIKRNTCGIYKINFPNGKYYIGMSIDIRRRMWEHNNCKKAKSPCDLAIKKYGKILSLEILEECQPSELFDKEAYWIQYYDATNKEKGYNLVPDGTGSGKPGEDSPVAVFTNQEVLDIRKRRYLGEAKKDVYKDYADKSHSTFEHVWLGRGYPEVGQEFLIPTNSISRQVYSSNANKGVKNGRAKMTIQNVKEIRERYAQHESIASIHKDFPWVARSTISRIAHLQGYQDIK